MENENKNNLEYQEFLEWKKEREKNVENKKNDIKELNQKK